MKYIERLCKSFIIHNLSFSRILLCDILNKMEAILMDKQHIEELRQQYIQNPPEGMTPHDIKHMSDNDLLDMDYFLHEDDDWEDEIDEEGFYLF